MGERETSLGFPRIVFARIHQQQDQLVYTNLLPPLFPLSLVGFPAFLPANGKQIKMANTINGSSRLGSFSFLLYISDNTVYYSDDIRQTEKSWFPSEKEYSIKKEIHRQTRIGKQKMLLLIRLKKKTATPIPLSGSLT